MAKASPLSAQIAKLGYPAKPQPKVVLQNLDLTLHAGELVALLGPNGVGKSTLLRTLAGLQAPLQGEVHLEGQPITQYSPLEKAQRISLVLTESVVPANLRVSELVALGRFPHTGYLGKLRAEDHQKIEAAIEACRIGYLAKERLAEISDGQRQKAMIARALAQDGPIMLLDEPTAHLDLPNKGEIMHLLHALARDTGKAILVSTHDLHLALQMADRLWLADCTDPLEVGLPEDLMLQGKLARLFQHPQFQVDPQTGQYQVRPSETGQPIWVQGDSPGTTWISAALRKNGFTLAESASQIVQVDQREGEWSFKIGEAPFTSIDATLSFLKGNI